MDAQIRVAADDDVAEVADLWEWVSVRWPGWCGPCSGLARSLTAWLQGFRTKHGMLFLPAGHSSHPGR
jgi:hypothetical protein